MVHTRDKVPTEDKWNVEALFPSIHKWKEEIAHLTQTDHFLVPLLKLKGTLAKDPQTLFKALELFFSINQKLDKLFTYAHLRHDEEITDNENKIAYESALTLVHQFQEETAWLEPEILAIPQEKLQEFLRSPVLKPYLFHLEKLLRLRENTLSAEQESLVAMAGQALDTPHKAFSAINNADFKFQDIQDAEGKTYELTHGLYQIYLRQPDRILRRNAFTTLHTQYLNYENTLCEVLQGQLQGHFFNARVHNFNSCLEAALKPKNINLNVYHSLIQATRSEIDALHDYVKLRQKLLKVDTLHPYDLYANLTPEVEIRMNYKEAEQAVIESTAPLGKEYQNTLREGLEINRWVDRYENKNKRSGAYSSGCYDSMPYILMNFKELLNDVFTLAHEAGHSMHSLLSHTKQPYHYSHYPIFVAEVASTFNEQLLMRHLMQQVKTREEKIFLINQQIEGIRTTLFRQTLFAEFELFLHECIEKKIPLTPTLLKTEYRKLNEFYFGKTLSIDHDLDIEWARIPHFYYNFYVYQYATGISAAIALSEKVLHGGEKERLAYLGFLESGCSAYPIDLLKKAGVDMESPHPVKAAITKFRSLVKELNELMS